MSEPLLIPYPPIEQHGVIGDRRTAAMVAADRTVDWFCLPDYDGPSVFGALLDAQRGGFYRLGPAPPILGHQRYLDRSAALVTTWALGGTELELIDAMAWPQDTRPPGGEPQRVLLRRLRCTRGEVPCTLVIHPRYDFGGPASAASVPAGVALQVGQHALMLWSSMRVHVDEGGAHAVFTLSQGDEAWAVLAFGGALEGWSITRAERILEESVQYWRDWVGALRYTGPRRDRVLRSLLTVHQMGYAPAGSLVAAPTTSLPERIGGDLNWDYRFAWVRDASLSLAVLSLFGDTQTAQRYMDWLAGLGSSTESPLQVVYRISGRTQLTEVRRTDLAGYRGSLPVRLGNRAAGQRQLDSLGYLVDCVSIYLEHGGAWRENYWQMVSRAADFTAAHWQRPDSGIWELPIEAHFVSSKVMSWVVLDRAVKIAERTRHTDRIDHWRSTMKAIHEEVMDWGWSDHLQAFRQRYGSEALDASVLLIPVMGFLPADHPRVLATADRIAESLTIDGFVHRFHAKETLGHEDLPLGEFEGAFLPCTFWLATTYALAGRIRDAETILARAEAAAGDLGLFPEEVDARSRSALGNTPLLFSQVEYLRAVLWTSRQHAAGGGRSHTASDGGDHAG